MVAELRNRQIVRVHTRYEDGVIESIAILDPHEKSLVKIVERGPRTGIFNPNRGTNGYMDSGERITISHFADGRVRTIDIASKTNEPLTTIILDDRQEPTFCVRLGGIVATPGDMVRAQPLRGDGATQDPFGQPARPTDPGQQACFGGIIGRMLRPGLGGQSG